MFTPDCFGSLLLLFIHQQNFVNPNMNKSMLVVSTYVHGDTLLAAGESGKSE